MLAIVRLGLAALIIAVLVRYDLIHPRELASILSEPIGATFSVMLLGTAFALGALRWFALLKKLDIPIGFRRTFEIYSAGAFCNAFLPGGTGGDVVRVVYLLRTIRSGRVQAMTSVLADRVCGLYGMLLVALVLVHANRNLVYEHASTAAIAGILYASFGLLTVVGAAALFAARPLARSSMLHSWANNHAVARIAYRIIETITVFRGNPSISIAALGISVVISILLVATVVLLSSARAWNGLSLLDVGNAAILALLAGTLPVTPGGIGVAEGAFAEICRIWSGEAAAYATVFLGYRLIAMIISALAMVMVLVQPRPKWALPNR
jgi:uncharacterized protein (TIRG00374 family)